MKDDVARRLARRLAPELLAAACADDRSGVPLAQRLEDAAPAVLTNIANVVEAPTFSAADSVEMMKDIGPLASWAWEEIAVRDAEAAARLREACKTDPGPVVPGATIFGLRVVLDPTLPEDEIQLRRIGALVERLKRT